MKNLPTVCLLLLWSLGTSAAQETAYQTQQSIREAARSHVLSMHPDGMDISIHVSDLDSRLRLKKCNKPIDTFSPPGKGRRASLSVGVRCRGRQKWTIYVPVRVEIRKMILVASRGLARGTVFKATDLRVEAHPVSRLHHGYFQDSQRVVGKTLTHDLREGDILTPRRVQSTIAVKRGNQVTILARTGSVNVRMEGVALSSGATGERIKVRNSSSSRQLEAMVTAPGIVEVSL